MQRFVMTDGSDQECRLDYLIGKLKEESVRYGNIPVSGDYGGKRRILRSLMNIRVPGEIPEDILTIQDEFLENEAKEKGIVTLDSIPSIKEQYASTNIWADKLSIWQGDITRLKTGAIVNAANSQMLGCFVPCHRCIDNAIHSAAGMQLREECSHIMDKKRADYGKDYEEPVGRAVITKGYNLPAEYVIHTVGPIVMHGLSEALCKDLQNCYYSVLDCAAEYKIRSVAFCCISTGEFHFPNKEAADIAVRTVTGFLEQYPDTFDRIIFNVFKETDKELYEERLM